MEVERALGTLDATHKVPQNPGLPREEHRDFPAPKYGDVTSEQNKLLFAKSLKYFTFCQFTGSVNARIKIGGEMTDTATSYGQVDTRYLLNVWAEGVRQAKRDAAAIRVLFPSFQVIAKIKI